MSTETLQIVFLSYQRLRKREGNTEYRPRDSYQRFVHNNCFFWIIFNWNKYWLFVYYCFKLWKCIWMNIYCLKSIVNDLKLWEIVWMTLMDTYWFKSIENGLKPQLSCILIVFLISLSSGTNWIPSLAEVLRCVPVEDE